MQHHSLRLCRPPQSTCCPAWLWCWWSWRPSVIDNGSSSNPLSVLFLFSLQSTSSWAWLWCWLSWRPSVSCSSWRPWGRCSIWRRRNHRTAWQYWSTTICPSPPCPTRPTPPRSRGTRLRTYPPLVSLCWPRLVEMTPWSTRGGKIVKNVAVK